VAAICGEIVLIHEEKNTTMLKKHISGMIVDFTVAI
jgi:hypothetical protein